MARCSSRRKYFVAFPIIVVVVVNWYLKKDNIVLIKKLNFNRSIKKS